MYATWHVLCQKNFARWRVNSVKRRKSLPIRKLESVRSRQETAVRTWHSLFFIRPSSRSGSKMAEWWGPERVLRHSRQSFSGPSQCVVCASLIQDPCSHHGTEERKRKRKRERERENASLERRFVPVFRPLASGAHFCVRFFFRAYIYQGKITKRFSRIDR